MAKKRPSKSKAAAETSGPATTDPQSPGAEVCDDVWAVCSKCCSEATPDGAYFILVVPAAGSNSPKADEPAALQKAERTAYEVRQELKTIKVSTAGTRLSVLQIQSQLPQRLPHCPLGPTLACLCRGSCYRRKRAAPALKATTPRCSQSPCSAAVCLHCFA